MNSTSYFSTAVLSDRVVRSHHRPIIGVPSVTMPRQTTTRNLVMVAPGMRSHHAKDFRRISAHIRELAKDVKPIVLRDRSWNRFHPALLTRPALVVSCEKLLKLRPLRGAICQGKLLSKSEEYEVLADYGIRIPKWALLTPTQQPALDAFGRYVVSKPDLGGLGASVKIKRASRVRWKAPTNARAVRCKDDRVVIQEFIYTGPWPVCYRVTTLFGKTMFSWRVEADRNRRRLDDPDDFDKGGHGGGGISICSSGAGCRFELNYEEDVIALGEEAHKAFPQHALLGVDIVREVPSGKLYVIEVNSCGGVWHISSSMGRSIQRDNGLDFESQFGAMRRAAEVLVEKTRQFAQ